MTVLPEMNRRDAEWEEIEIYLWVCVQRKSINCTRQNLNYDFLKPPTGTRVQSCSYSQVRLRRQHPEDIVACCEKSSPSLDITNMCRGSFCVTWLVTGEVFTGCFYRRRVCRAKPLFLIVSWAKRCFQMLLSSAVR